MKSWTLALAVLLALLIGWLAWRSRASDAPPVAAQSPATAVAEPRAEEVSSAGVPADSRTALDSGSEAQSVVASPAAAELDSAEILVRGTVSDEQGQPAPGVSVRWIDERGIETTSTASAGSYSAAGLHAGRYVVKLRGGGWRQEQYEAALDVRPAVQQRDFVLHSNARILIRIASTDGTPLIGFDEHERPLPGNQLRAYTSRRVPPARLDPETLVRQANSDCGQFSNHWDLARTRPDIGPDCLGEVELFEPPPLCVSLVLGCAVVATRELAEVPAEILFTLDPSAIRSQLSGLRVRLLQPDGKTPVANGGFMLFADASPVANVDSDGRAELLDRLPGLYELDIHAPGAGSRRRTVVLEPGQVLDLGEIALAPGPKLCLRFVFPAGAQTQVLFVLKPEHPGDPLATLGPRDNVRFGSGDKNPYELTCFDPGTYELRVVGFGDPSKRESSHLGVRPMRIVLGGGAPGEYAVRIEPTTELCLRPPLESSRVSYWLVSTADGLPCRAVRIEGHAPERIELVRGEYTIAHIDSDTKALGQPQLFSVGSSFFTLELQP